ncbi:MAG: phosphoesterase [Planctomycetaceae bacterium]|nr:phosphoesterase [Planctomycetaceae bacterium]
MFAIISDIHANLEALTAVLADVRQRGVNELICLGDVIGYGPDPVECLRQASVWPVVVAGDWDRAVVKHDPTQWIDWINRHIEWIQRTISSASDGEALLSTVASFRAQHSQLGCQFCHGTPSDVRDYVFPEDIYNQPKLERIACEFDRTLFAGHTHIPGLFALSSGGEWEYIEASPGQEYDVREYTKLICNVGSIGQPRDGDSRASFVLFDGHVIRFHRVDYDMDTTVAKIKDNPDIDDMHGGRLPEGR